MLGTARAFEDLGVSAYNGAGRFIKSADYLLIAGKVVSVEARHAAVIRALLAPGTDSFANFAYSGNGIAPRLDRASRSASTGLRRPPRCSPSRAPT